MSVPGNDNHTEDFSFGEKGQQPFSSPDGYFDAFSAKLQARLEREEELKAFPVLAGMQRGQAFEVPDRYFAENAEHLEQAAELASHAVLSTMARPVAEALDAAYLEAFDKKLDHRLELADELNAYPVLSALDKYSGFAVDPGYFENFAGNLHLAAASAPGAQPRPSLWARFTAAVLRPRMVFNLSCGLLLCLGVWVVLQTDKPSGLADTGDCKTVACLEPKEILNDHTVHTFTDDNLFDMVDVNALSHQLTNTINTDSLPTEQYVLDNVNTDQLLENL